MGNLEREFNRTQIRNLQKVKTFEFCDRKARVASAQSFTLWQQATIEITRRDHSRRTPVITFNHSHVSNGRAYTPRSLHCCLFAPQIYGVVLRAYSVRGEPRIQRNANREVATWSSCTSNEGFVIRISWHFVKNHIRYIWHQIFRQCTKSK